MRLETTSCPGHSRIQVRLDKWPGNITLHSKIWQELQCTRSFGFPGTLSGQPSPSVRGPSHVWENKQCRIMSGGLHALSSFTEEKTRWQVTSTRPHDYMHTRISHAPHKSVSASFPGLSHSQILIAGRWASYRRSKAVGGNDMRMRRGVCIESGEFI